MSRVNLAMSLRVGIGVITYNRRHIVMETIDRVVAHTRRDCDLIVADDGSADGTAQGLRDRGLSVVGGRNMGIAWNKNRALFHLIAVKGCDVAILLEDDTSPNVNGWEEDWIAAALRYGHVNLAGPWMRHTFCSGTGTVADPILGRNVTAQCSAFSRESIAFAGYMDTRFKGFGYEHVEHSFRLSRLGYGGVMVEEDGQPQFRHVMIAGGVTVTTPPSHGNPDDIQRNLELCGALMTGPVFRLPWQDEAELRQLREELGAVETTHSDCGRISVDTGHSVRQQVIGQLYRGADPFHDVAPRLYARDMQGWNSEHPYLTETIARHRPRIAVEIGVWKGGSTIRMARAIQTLGLDAVVIAVDTWLGSWDHWVTDQWFSELCLSGGYPALFHKFAANVIGEGLAGFVVPLPLDSGNAAQLLAKVNLRPGVIHIDGGHDYHAVMTDLERWWPLLLPGGAMILDDYIADGTAWVEVKQAIEDFFTRTPHIEFEAIHPKARVTKPTG